MTELDLNSLSLAELKQLQKDVARALAGFEDRRRADARAALEAQAKALGFTLADFVGEPSKRTRAPAEAKYRHPENAEVTWSGRGRKPRWFTDALAAGKSAESMAA